MYYSITSLGIAPDSQSISKYNESNKKIGNRAISRVPNLPIIPTPVLPTSLFPPYTVIPPDSLSHSHSADYLTHFSLRAT